MTFYLFEGSAAGLGLVLDRFLLTDDMKAWQMINHKDQVLEYRPDCVNYCKKVTRSELPPLTMEDPPAVLRSFSQLSVNSSHSSDASGDRMTDALSVSHTHDLPSSGSSGVSGSLDASVLCADEAIRRLEHELMHTRRALLEKEQKCSHLSTMQNAVDTEVHELTENLFTEAYRMVNKAEERRQRAEKLLKESSMKVDVLEAEVDALKLLLRTPGSTGSHHSSHSPQHKPLFKFLNNSGKPSSKGGKEFGEASLPTGKKSSSLPSTSKELEAHQRQDDYQIDQTEQIDPILYREFCDWRSKGHPMSEEESEFMQRIYREDIRPCMEFDNKKLSESILSAIIANKMGIEPVQSSQLQLKSCSLTCVPRFCPFRLRTDSPDGSHGEWSEVSQLARNRIAAICDFFTYLRYLHLGIVRGGVREAFLEVVTLRRNMALARLGLAFVPKSASSAHTVHTEL